jgi:UDP-N-acetylmuramoyl-tripeptide--D-alanyl-D-alanine ligase
MSVPALGLGEIARAVGGELVKGDPETVIRSYDIDTRRLGPGSLFFALPGSRTDGHEFLGEAARRGAAAAVVRHEPAEGSDAPAGLIRVEDPGLALGRCGALARDKQKSMQVVAVTGSAGKTITKEMVAAGLSPGKRVHRTHGNLNNHLGLPLTLLACPDDTEIAVVEMGMSAPGEIGALSRIARPDVALVTNVAPVHLQYFQGLDGIAAAKGELFGTLHDDGVAVVNLDDDRVVLQSQRHAGKRVTYGRKPGADVRMLRVEDRYLPGTSMTFQHGGQERNLDLRMGGGHAARNALAALAAVVAAGGDLDAGARAIAAVEPGAGRGRIHRRGDGIMIIDDSYNSNPAALASVLQTLSHTKARGRKVMVMGDMLELGTDEAAMHRDAGKQIASAGVRALFGVGRLTHATTEAARRAGVPETHHHKDAGTAARELPEFLRPGDLVLIKGSRGIRLEKVVDALLRTLPRDSGARQEGHNGAAGPRSDGETGGRE